MEKIERPCGKVHPSILDAWVCCKSKVSPAEASFGDLGTGVNLWWGAKETGHLRNRGLVIGLRNLEAGIGWRLDYDPEKLIHINQHNDNGGQWPKVYHPIKMRVGDPEGFVFQQWIRWTKMNDTRVPPDIVERMGGSAIKDYRSLGS